MLALQNAQRFAEELLEMLQPACDRIEIAGSVRRRKTTVKDLELVAIPRMVDAPDQLFATGAEVSALDQQLDRLTKGRSGLTWNVAKPANGDRYKRLIFRHLPVDLFVVRPPATWGVIFALRTGPAEFSHLLVKRRCDGGAMPDTFRTEHGYLSSPAGRMHTPSEHDYFLALDLPYFPPHERTVARLLEEIHRKPETAGHAV